MCDEFEEEEIVFLVNKDYFTLNDCAFFRIISNKNNTVIAAKLFALDENEEFQEIETGIYPIETIKEALLWDEENILQLEYK